MNSIYRFCSIWLHHSGASIAQFIKKRAQQRAGYSVRSILLVTIITLIPTMPIRATTASELSPEWHEHRLNVQYLTPADADRNINTLNFDFNMSAIRFQAVRLSVFLNISGTYATGNITQLIGEFDEGTLSEIQLDTSAFGLGPGLLLEFDLLEFMQFEGSLQVGANIFLYNRKFPVGGDRYNFMIRVGPAFAYRLDRSNWIGLGYQWAHVSNGQGISIDNPSYDSRGLSLSWNRSF